jgi:non-specific serine/threonine protein kinase
MLAWDRSNDDLCIRHRWMENSYPTCWRQKQILFLAMNLMGQTVNGRYQLDAVVGSGGMATVYRATDRLLSQTIALKLLTPNQSDQPNTLRRFMAEAHTMMRLHHPNVVTILDFGDGPQPFIAMELVEGGSVSDLLENMDVTNEAQAFAIIDGVLSGLAHIHASGTIHRDIKPANILLTQSGIPKLTDFGVARAPKQNSFHTNAGAIMGTLAFMAPEQRTSATAVTEASDLYSVGATLYTLLTRRSTLDLYVREKQEEAFHALRGGLREFLTRACSFIATDRFANASEMQAALRSASKTAGASPQQGAPPPVVTSLPPVRGVFFGRSEELDQLSVWSNSTSSRMISIVGLGGIGKSRLALEFCHRQTFRFTGGVWRIDLSAIQSDSGLYQALGSALNLNFEGREPLQEIARYLDTQKSCLLMFDNAEDARSALTPCLANLIEHVPDLRVIVTTREELNRPWETLLSVKEMDLRASVALLMQAVGHTFILSDQSKEGVQAFEDIASLLEGHPLSLELAAAQLDMMSPAQLYSRLSRSLNTVVPSEGLNLVGLLDTVWSDTAPQSSVQASLAWSWSMLSASEQSALAQCALFVNGFDLETAEAVVDFDPPSQAPSLMILLQALRSRNLIRIRTPFPGTRRLSVPRLVGAFAVAHGNRGELHQAELRMARHFSLMGEEAQIHQNRTGGVHRHRIAQLEIPNIQHCFEWAIEHQHPDLSAFLSLAASALLRNSGPFEGVTAMLRRAKKSITEDTPLLARVLSEQGRIATHREGVDVAEQLLNEAISLADSLDIASVATQARVHLAYVLARTNRLDLAIPMARAAVEIANQADDLQDRPSALYCRGYLTYRSGEPRKALTDLQSALRGFQQMGDRTREGVCFGNLGEYHHYVGDSKRAKQCYTNAQAIALEQNDKASLVRGHRRLAWLHMDAGEWTKAEESVRCGLRVARELGDLPGEAAMVGTLGTVVASSGQFELALAQFREAEQMYEQHGNADQGQNCRVNICFALEKLNRIDEAYEIVEDLKTEKQMVPFTKHFVTVLEMKLRIRREDWHTALELGDSVMVELENLQAWDRTLSVHAYRAICHAALGGNPDPHLAKAKALMVRLNLAEGSQEGVLIAETVLEVNTLQQKKIIDGVA